MDLICGINPVLEALNARSRHFDRLVVAKGTRNKRVSEAIAKATQLGVPLRFESREALDRLSGGVPHQGLIAVVSPKPVSSLEDLLEAARDPALLLLLDSVVDPRNLGALIRCADVAGADGVVLPERHSAGLSEVVARASAGALEHVPVARVGNLSQAIGTLQKSGLWVIALDAEGGERWDTVDMTRPIALVAGGEGRGVRRLVKERSDQVVTLPTFGRVESLNVAVATGIVLYEVIRQRGAAPSRVRPIPPAPPPLAHVIGPSPDDTEDDPGLFRYAPVARAGEDLEEEREDPVSLVMLDDEDVAWGGSGAVEVVKRRTQVRNVGARARRPGQGVGGRGRRAKGAGKTTRGRSQPGTATGAETPPPGQVDPNNAGPSDATPSDGGDAAKPRSPARRKRRRRSGARAGTSGGAAPAQPVRETSSPEESSGESSRPPARRRRRRRRNGGS
jgi:23S rRNA (guanosine2251-2'-O)-methyltransferase